MKPILYFAPWCPDTAPFVEELKRLNIAYEERNIVANSTNFKDFLKLRDSHMAFEQVKKNGYIGIPVLLILEKSRVIFDKEALKKL